MRTIEPFLLLVSSPTADPAPVTDVTMFIEIGLVIFFVVFLAIIIWVVFLRPGKYKAEKRIPLEDERIVTPRDNEAESTADVDTEKESPNAGS